MNANGNVWTRRTRSLMICENINITRCLNIVSFAQTWKVFTVSMDGYFCDRCAPCYLEHSGRKFYGKIYHLEWNLFNGLCKIIMRNFIQVVINFTIELLHETLRIPLRNLPCTHLQYNCFRAWLVLSTQMSQMIHLYIQRGCVQQCTQPRNKYFHKFIPSAQHYAGRPR